MTPSQIGFLLLSALTLAGALGAVTLSNITRALLSLVLFFLGVAGLFFALRAEFIGVVQVLVYIGAVAVLIVFAIALTRSAAPGSSDGARDDLPPLSSFRPVGVLGAGLIGGGLVLAVMRATEPAAAGATPAGGADVIGRELMTRYVLPFEIASVLLTAALVGAVVIAVDEVKRR